MIPQQITRRFQRLLIVAVASAAWTNRDDLARWARFIRLAFDQRKKRTLPDLVTEVRVRAAVTADPMLRRDSALKDLSVSNGVVTLITTEADWPAPHERQIRRLKRVKGVSDVVSHAEQACLSQVDMGHY